MPPGRSRSSAHPFLEAIELSELGEFECADVSALCTDFLLEIGDYALQICGTEASAKELIPEPFAIEAQAESLSSADQPSARSPISPKHEKLVPIGVRTP